VRGLGGARSIERGSFSTVLEGAEKAGTCKTFAKNIGRPRTEGVCRRWSADILGGGEGGGGPGVRGGKIANVEEREGQDTGLGAWP